MAVKSHEYLATVGPLILSSGIGMVLGYSATLLPQLQPGYNGTVTVTEEQASWIASVAVPPMAFGSLLGGYLLEKFGRKSAHTIICLPKAFGWILITFASSVEQILLGRILTGLCSGVLNAITGVYISEICLPKHRGFLLAAMSAAFAFGLALVHLLGTFLPWKTTALIASCFPILSWVLLILSHESPPYLAKRGKMSEAEKAYFWLHGKTETTKQEIEELLSKQKVSADKQMQEQPKKSARDYLSSPFLKPLGILAVFFVLCQCSGPNVMNFYSVTIIRKIIGDSFDEYLIMIIVDIIRLIASVVACVLSQKYNRRPLALVSGTGTVLSLFSLSCYGYLERSYPNISSQYYIIPIVALASYIFFISVAFVPLPWALQGELFPLWGRSMGSGICTFCQCVAAFFIIKTSLKLIHIYGAEGIFLLFGCAASFCTIFVYFCLPETRGKTLDEIEECFKSNKRVVRHDTL